MAAITERVTDPMKPSDERTGLETGLGDLTLNATTARLYEHALQGTEGVLAEHGALVVDTGRFTGRSPQDKFVVRDALTENSVDWGSINQPLSQEHYGRLKDDMLNWVQGRRLFRQGPACGPGRAVPAAGAGLYGVRLAHLFARTMFVRDGSAADGAQRWTVIDLPGFKADPERHGVRSDTAVVLNFSDRTILIANTEYAGEIKKGIFSAMNFELPDRGVMPMHCSADRQSR